jgi:Nif-specific regulatory protein
MGQLNESNSRIEQSILTIVSDNRFARTKNPAGQPTTAAHPNPSAMTRQTPRLERYFAATASIASTREEGKLLEAIIGSAQEVIEAEAASVLILEPDGGHLRFAMATGPQADKVLPLRVPVEGSIAGWVVINQRPLNLTSAVDDPRHFGGVDTETDTTTQSLLCVPLMVDDEVIGAIEAVNKLDGRQFSEEDECFLKAIAVQAAYALRQAEEYRRRREELAQLREQIAAEEFIVGRQGSLAPIFQIIDKVADTKTTLLIRGETGTGKGLVARAVYRAARRYNRRLVTVNCANIPSELLETELFGHAKGAFTGADANKKGKFAHADGGTIFLDEIGDMAPKLQTKLLRVLQEQEFEPLGSNRTVKVDLRVITATNRDLEQLIEQGRFREDLYYRLNVVALEVPPLRERREDLPAMVEHFLKKFSLEMNKRMFSAAPEALEVIYHYAWPGNIRELENALERAVVLNDGETLLPEMLPTHVRGKAREAIFEGETLEEAQRNFRRWFIAKTLAAHDNNQTRAAEALGIQRSYLNRLIKQLEIGKLLQGRG